MNNYQRIYKPQTYWATHQVWYRWPKNRKVTKYARNEKHHLLNKKLTVFKGALTQAKQKF